MHVAASGTGAGVRTPSRRTLAFHTLGAFTASTAIIAVALVLAAGSA